MQKILNANKKNLAIFLIAMLCFILLSTVARRPVGALIGNNPTLYSFFFCLISFIVLVLVVERIKKMHQCLNIFILAVFWYLISLSAYFLTTIIASTLPYPALLKYINPIRGNFFGIINLGVTTSLLLGWVIFPLFYFLSDSIYKYFSTGQSHPGPTAWDGYSRTTFDNHNGVTTSEVDKKESFSLFDYYFLFFDTLLSHGSHLRQDIH